VPTQFPQHIFHLRMKDLSRVLGCPGSHVVDPSAFILRQKRCRRPNASPKPVVMSKESCTQAGSLRSTALLAAGVAAAAAPLLRIPVVEEVRYPDLRLVTINVWWHGSGNTSMGARHAVHDMNKPLLGLGVGCMFKCLETDKGSIITVVSPSQKHAGGCNVSVIRARA
jgi:hypothetical protein